jgi:phosphohistidine phosphatase SixA
MVSMGLNARGPLRLLVRSAETAVPVGCCGHDADRGLTDVGLRQADRLVLRLRSHSIRRVLSSPALRCRQTVAPLAIEAGLEVERCRLLGPDADAVTLARFLRDADTSNALLCTHLSTLVDLFMMYATAPPRFIAGIAPMRPAALWTLQDDGDAPPRVRYLPPDQALEITSAAM